MLCSLVHFQENNPKKAALKIAGRFPTPGDFQISVCNQCGACAAVCPVEAIKEKDGVYLIDRDECIGCLVCVESCPEEAFVVHPAENVPIKCDACGECIKYCPRGALIDADGQLQRVAK